MGLPCSESAETEKEKKGKKLAKKQFVNKEKESRKSAPRCGMRNSRGAA